MNVDYDQLPLRDIHLPEPIGWWPPAPGWWLIPLLVTAALTLTFLVRRLIRRGRLKKRALQRLEQLTTAYRSSGNQAQLARELSVLLRRLALSINPRTEVAALTGEQWLHYLDRTMDSSDGERSFRQGTGRCLLDAPYRPQDQSDAEALIALVRRWILVATLNPQRSERTG